ncbi:MAG: hypothetical protein EHM21_17690, partial [Chloroflexi bacterium]
MRNFRGRAWLAWLICAVVVILSLFSTASQLAAARSSAGPMMFPGETLFTLVPVMFAIPAALILSRQPRNTIGWLLMVLPMASVPADLITSYLSTFQAAPPPATLPIFL